MYVYDLRRGDQFKINTDSDGQVYEFLGMDGPWAKLRSLDPQADADQREAYSHGASFWVVSAMTEVDRIE